MQFTACSGIVSFYNDSADTYVSHKQNNKNTMALVHNSRCEEAMIKKSPTRMFSHLCFGVISATLLLGSPSVGADSEDFSGVATAIVDDTRIIGGGKAPAGKWPSMVALVNSSGTTLFNRQFCGGTKVADRWILTAAHCMFDFSGNLRTPDSLKVVGGITDLADAAAVEVVVSNIYLHPSYSNTAANPVNDIALLELGEDLGDEVESVPLYTQPQTTLVGVNAAIVGWGAVDLTDGQASFPTHLQEAVVPVVSVEQCNAMESYQGFIQQGQMCAGYKNGGIDSCSGDSGGPLFIQVGGEVHQAGITSFGNGCAEPNFYGVYSEVASFESWLSQYVPEYQSEDGEPGGVPQQVDGFEPSNRASSGAAWGMLLLLIGVGTLRRLRQ